MSEWKTVDVRVDPVYTVSIGSGLLRRCGALLRPVIAPCRVAVLSDDTVAPLYADTVCESLRCAGYGVCRWTFPAGEAHKNMVRKKPRNSLELRQVSGVGEVKAGRYGRAFLACIAENG